MSRRRITLSSSFGRMLKFQLPCLYDKLRKRAYSVDSHFAHAMLHLLTFQHLSHVSYSVSIAPITMYLFPIRIDHTTFIHKNPTFSHFPL